MLFHIKDIVFLVYKEKILPLNFEIVYNQYDYSFNLFCDNETKVFYYKN